MKAVKFVQLLGLTILFGAGSLFAQQPLNYQRNSHVKLESAEAGNIYWVNYSFLDQDNAPQAVSMNLPVKQTQRMVSRYGIPKELLQPYLATEEVIRVRKQVLREGLFSTDGKVITADLSAVTSYYRPYCQQIAVQLLQILALEGKDSRRNRIELAMKFVQDIPYGVPQLDESERYFGGLLTPPEVLLYRYGDCDSKSVLFAGILSYMIDPDDIVFLRCPDHVLTGISGEPEAGQFFVVGLEDGKKYILAETAGPGRVRWGNPGSTYRSGKQYRIEKLALQEHSDAEWSLGERGYYFSVGGKTVTDRLTNAWAGNDLLVFDNATGHSYLLEDFRTRNDRDTHPARVLIGPAFWMREGNKFYFFVDGQSVGHRTISTWEGNDVLLKDTGTGQTFRLKNFRNTPDNYLTSAFVEG